MDNSLYFIISENPKESKAADQVQGRLGQLRGYVNAIVPEWKNAGNLDYVSKAADLITGTAIRAALVSTNSVTQGEAVAKLHPSPEGFI